MAQVLQQALGPQWADPYAEARAALQARLAQPVAPPYTTEQMTERRAQNEREHALGLLGMLSGNEQLGNVGGAVLKRALAQRDPRVSERGTTDSITGQFTYSPDYLRQRDEQQLAQLDAKSAASREKFDAERRGFTDKQELQRQRAEDARILKQALGGAAGGGALGGGPAPQVGVDESGAMVYRQRNGQLFKYDESGQAAPHAGRLLPKPGAVKEPTEAERGTMGFLSRMRAAAPKLEALEARPGALPTFATAAADAVPGGRVVRPLLETKEQQQYRQYAEDWIRAKLRKESGASIPPAEMHEEYRTYFPMPGEHPSILGQKRQARREAEKQFMYSAGRALSQELPAAPGAGGDADADPLGLRKAGR